MPGRDYNKAYKLLEQSIVGHDPAAADDDDHDDDDSAFSGDYDDGNDGHNAEDLESISAHAGLALLDSRKRASYAYTGSLRLLTPPQINGHGNALPPLTPLSHSGSSTVSGVRVRSQASDNHDPQYPTASTPPNQVDPPTPDLTPPNRAVFQPSSISSTPRLASPYPESFQTAREDIASNTTGTPHHQLATASLEAFEPDLPAPTKLEQVSQQGTGFGLRPSSGEQFEFDDQVTPRATDAPHSAELYFQDQDENAIEEEEDEEIGIKYRFFDDAYDSDDDDDDDARMTSVITTTTSESALFRNVSVRKTRRLYEANHNGEDTATVIMRGDAEAAHQTPLDDAVSALKNAGVVEEDTRVRKSRDFTWPLASKPKAHYQVRELSEERPRSNPRTPPVIQAMVVDSPPTRARKLRHVSKCSSIRDEASVRSDRSTRNSFGSDKSPPQILHHMKKQIPDRRERRLSKESDPSPHSSPSLRRRRDTIPSRPSTAPDENKEFENKEFTVPEELAGLNISQVEAPDPPQRSEVVAEEVVPDKVPIEEAAKQTPTRQFQTPDMIDDAVRKALRAKPAPSQTPVVQEQFYQPLADEDDFRAGKPLAFDNQLLPPPSINFGHAHRFSTGQTTIASSYGRPSLDQDKSAISSPMYFRLGSLGSLQSGTPELIEANAVPLFAHNNGSLQVVQHTPPATRSLALNDSELSGQPGPVLEPTTPIQPEPVVVGVDSPLRNPRPAPDLPTVSIIPPTPAKELEALEALHVSKQRSSSAPQKPATFMQRARRYSGNLTQSLRRSVSGRRPATPSSEHHGRLHPFWRPRHFWNDLSDSEDEYEDEDDDYYDDEAHDQLPRGGDTSNVATPPPEPANTKFKRGGSFRGFLIGNSLGLQRGPTNKRRPVIILPSRRGVNGVKQNGEATASSPEPARDSKPEKLTSVRKSAQRSGSVRKPRGRSTSRFFGAFTSKMRSLSERREEKEREKNREKVRASIGPVWYVDHDGTGGRVRE